MNWINWWDPPLIWKSLNPKGVSYSHTTQSHSYFADAKPFQYLLYYFYPFCSHLMICGYFQPCKWRGIHPLSSWCGLFWWQTRQTHNLPLYTLPPLQSDISPNQGQSSGSPPLQNMAPPYNSPFPTNQQLVPTPPNLPFSLHDLPSLLSNHGLCVMAIPFIPPQSKQKDQHSKKPKLQRELQGLYSSIHYDKTATLPIREGSSAIQWNFFPGTFMVSTFGGNALWLKSSFRTTIEVLFYYKKQSWHRWTLYWLNRFGAPLLLVGLPWMLLIRRGYSHSLEWARFFYQWNHTR